MGYKMTAVLNVLVIGHSHIYWLGKFADASDLFANFRETCVQMQRDIGMDCHSLFCIPFILLWPVIVTCLSSHSSAI